MIILRRTYMLVALMYSTQCMRILAVISAFSSSNAVEHHASLRRGRLFLAQAALLAPYVLMVGTSKLHDIFCKSCGGRKSIHSPVFCNSCAERRKGSCMFTSKLEEKQEERFKSANEFVYQSNLEKERKVNQQKKEREIMKGMMDISIEKKKESGGKGNVKYNNKDAAPMNIKKTWISMWNSERASKREDENKKEREMKERQRAEEQKRKKIKEKQREEEIKKLRRKEKKLMKEKEREMEKERKRKEREHNNKKRTERCFKRDHRKEHPMMDVNGLKFFT